MGNNLKEIRLQIQSVKSTQKITKAMKLVSTSKLKRADEMARRSRLYANKIVNVLQEIHDRFTEQGGCIDIPFFARREGEPKKVDIVFITADKGLCGGFNSTTIKEILRLLAEYKSKSAKVRLHAIGKKGISYFEFNGISLASRVEELSSVPDYQKSSKFINGVVNDFLEGNTDRVILVHNGFKNMISQQLKTEQLLPIEDHVLSDDGNIHAPIDIEPEEGESEILNQLAKKYIEFSMYFALVDSLVAEHSARMQAMDSATNNAGEIVRNRTIAYNKARQEAITTELVEINTGVEAMK